MICNKCSSRGTIILRKKDNYCNDCFLSGTNHKFRSSIGKNKILTKNDNVLICVSGGPGSIALLDLVHTGINMDVHKKLRIIPHILHLTDEDNDGADILKQCDPYNFDVYLVPVSEYLNTNKNLPPVKKIPNENDELKNEFKSIIRTLPATSCIDFIDQVKRSLFISYAKLLNCRYIFTAEIASTLAMKMLSSLAIGRGSQIQDNIGFIDQRDETKIIRPMKDITKEELDYYISLKQLSPVEKTNAYTKNTNSLQTIISNFVIDLQENFQSTISTVCKTADKIGSTSLNVENNDRCCICQSALSHLNDTITALEATNISKSVSFGKPIEDTSTPNEMFPLIYKLLCYSCSKNYSNVKHFNFHNFEKIINDNK